MLNLIRQKQDFVLHAPRQTGKTTVMGVLQEELNSSGAYRCVYVNVEIAKADREDVGAAVRAILSTLARESAWTVGDRSIERIWPESSTGTDRMLLWARCFRNGPGRLEAIGLVRERDRLAGGRHPGLGAPAAANTLQRFGSRLAELRTEWRLHLAAEIPGRTLTGPNRSSRALFLELGDDIRRAARISAERLAPEAIREVCAYGLEQLLC